MPADASPDPGWRAILADCWDQEAAARLERLNRGDRDATARWARATIARAELTVRQRLDARGGSARRELAQAAARALEACAATWEAFGPVAGARQLHLVRRLEQQLAEHERIVRAAEAGYRVDRHAVSARARAARSAIDRLCDGGQDAARVLLALEHNALALAALAIRAIENIDAAGRSAPAAVDALLLRFAELHSHSQRLLDCHHRDDLGRWLTESLVIAARLSAPGASGQTPGEPNLGRTAAEPQARRRWVRLGARELLIARELTGSAPPGPDPGRIAASAASILADTGLAARPAALDPQLAAQRHVRALSTLVPICARAVREDAPAAQAAQLILTGRLARVLAVLWLIDRRPPVSVRRE
jgi:hypothetical protein